MKKTDVAVIGGGAAGLVAAITAARSGVRCVLIEHTDRVGKKLLVTGNGKCNYTNALQGISYYRGDDPAFVLSIFEQFGQEETVAFFRELGIYPKIKNGYYYPSSGQASSVLDVLRMELSHQNVSVALSCNIKHIAKHKDRFVIQTAQETYEAGAVLVATGLLAYPKTGSDGSFIPLIKQFGHHFAEIVPALVQLKCKQSFFKKLAGIRTDARVTLWVEKNKAAEASGEVQLTEFGISGIPVFEVSRFATRALKEGKSVYATLDFAPQLTESELKALMKERFHTYGNDKTCAEALNGFFHKKLNDVLLEIARLSPEKRATSATDAELERLCRVIQSFRVDVTGSKGFDSAQVCAGGVRTDELDAHALESKLVPGLYFAGEVIDIDGTCGGYNLQWAWSSGVVAARHAAEHIRLCHEGGARL